MTVVSDSSPLIALARIGQLSLLAKFYGRLRIAPEVHREVTIAGRGLPGAEEVRRAGWIEIAKPDRNPDADLVAACEGLGAGERGTILLAQTISADLVLLDDGKARRVARRAGCRCSGASVCWKPARKSDSFPICAGSTSSCYGRVFVSIFGCLTQASPD